MCTLFTQGFISGFALIPPWALKKYRAYGTHNETVEQSLPKDKFYLSFWKPSGGLNQYGVLRVIFCSRLSFLLWSILYRVFVSVRNVVVKASLIVMSELSIALIVD